ncbi:MAG: hypothetical protein ACTSXJ_03640 [Candidatus Baldrarchaeia archaeon]
MVPVRPLEESFGDSGEKMLQIAAEISEKRRREEEHDRSELRTQMLRTRHRGLCTLLRWG